MTDNKKKKDTKDDYIIYNVKHEFIGNVTPIQAILPIVMEDIKRKREKYIEEQKKNKNNVEN